MPLLFRDSTYYMGTPREVSEYGHFVFFLPIIEEPCAVIDWVPEWKYLGVTLKSGVRFGCSVKDKVKLFYRSLNGILRVEGRSDDMILLGLIEAHCIPILTYGMEIIHMAQRDERRSL